MRGSSASSVILIRSPSNAPPLSGLDGSMATIARVDCSLERAMLLISVLLPTPGGPVIPTTAQLSMRGSSCRSASATDAFASVLNSRERLLRSSGVMAGRKLAERGTTCQQRRRPESLGDAGNLDGITDQAQRTVGRGYLDDHRAGNGLFAR